jgi:hypothetical protein
MRQSRPRSLGDWGVRDRGCTHGGTGPPRDCAKELVCAAVVEIAIRAVRWRRDGRRVGAAFVSPRGGKRARLSGCPAARSFGGALAALSLETPTTPLCPQPIKSLSCSISFSEWWVEAGVFSAPRPLTNEHSSYCPVAKFVHGRRERRRVCSRVIPWKRNGSRMRRASTRRSFRDTRAVGSHRPHNYSTLTISGHHPRHRSARKPEKARVLEANRLSANRHW